MSRIADLLARSSEPLLLRPADHRPSPALLPVWIAAAARGPTWRRTECLLLLITAFLVLQFVIPARLVIGGLGAVGRPSVVVALGLGLVWLAAWLCIDAIPAGRQPVRWLVAAFFLTSLVSYGVGYARGLSEVEASSADRHLILLIAMCGLALAVADGVRDRATLDEVLLRLTRLAGVMAAFGAVQALFRVNLTDYIRIPGLRANRELLAIGARGDEGLARVAGTANHYIEFGVVLAMVTPVAVHYALQSVGRAQVTRRWALVMLIASGVPFSVSRSAVISLAVSVGILALAWTWRMRLRAAVAGFVAVAVFHVLQPGFLGTLRALFANTENDPSVQNRLSDYPIVHAYFVERPWLGRGLATFLPDEYILLDNELLYLTVTTGLIGVLTFVLLFAGGFLVGRDVRCRAADDSARHLGQALAGTLVAALVASATFDSMSFPTFVGVVFLCLGAVGALYRLARVEEQSTSARRRMPPIVSMTLGERWRRFRTADLEHGSR